MDCIKCEKKIVDGGKICNSCGQNQSELCVETQIGTIAKTTFLKDKKKSTVALESSNSLVNTKCSYCGKKSACFRSTDDETIYCDMYCKNIHEKALLKVRKNMKWFAIGIILSLTLILSSAFQTAVQANYLGGGGMLIAGITLTLFPFCTPEAYEMYGYKKTTLIGRSLGMITEMIGLALIFFG